MTDLLPAQQRLQAYECRPLFFLVSFHAGISYISLETANKPCSHGTHSIHTVMGQLHCTADQLGYD